MIRVKGKAVRRAFALAGLSIVVLESPSYETVEQRHRNAAAVPVERVILCT